MVKTIALVIMNMSSRFEDDNLVFFGEDENERIRGGTCQCDAILIKKRR